MKKRKTTVYKRVAWFLLPYMLLCFILVLVLTVQPVAEGPVKENIPVFDYSHSLPKFEVKTPILEVKSKPHPTLAVAEMTTSEVVLLPVISEVINDETDLLARCISAEGRSESYNTQLLIGSVILNRVKSGKFPNTIEEVINQKNQFYVVTRWDKQINDYMINREAESDAVEIAKHLMSQGSVLPDDVLVFYGDYCTESWTTSRRVYEKSDHTIFAYTYK